MKSVALWSTAIIALLGTSSLAHATTSKGIPGDPKGPNQFIDFEQTPVGTPVNGLRTNGATFSFGFPRGATNSNATINTSFPPTNHTNGRGIAGPTFGILGINFDTPVKNFSFGFALLGPQGFVGDGSVREAVIVDFFDPEGAFIGSMSSNAFQYSFDDRGGGAEYATARFSGNATRIGSVSMNFTGSQEPIPDLDSRGFPPVTEFFVDNINFEFIAVPLPTPGLLVAIGLAAIAGVRRRRAMI